MTDLQAFAMTLFAIASTWLVPQLFEGGERAEGCAVPEPSPERE